MDKGGTGRPEGVRGVPPIELYPVSERKTPRHPARFPLAFRRFTFPAVPSPLLFLLTQVVRA
jgi:hypothetical protein